MYKKSLFGAAFVLFGLLVSSPKAEMELLEDFSFTVPYLTGSISAIHINDINHDNVPEILLSDTEKVMLYLPGYSIPSFSAPMYAGYWAGRINHRLLLDDVNRDRVADIVVAYYFRDDTDLIGSMRYVLIVYDGNSAYREADTVTGSLYLADLWGRDEYFGITALQALDVNNDSYKEMLVAFETGPSSGWITETDGLTMMYQSFPSSIIWQSGTLLGNFAPFYTLAGKQYYLSSKYYVRQWDGPGVNGQSISVLPVLVDGVSSITTIGFYEETADLETSLSSSDSYSEEYLLPLCNGNISGLSNIGDILASHYWLLQYTDYDPVTYEPITYYQTGAGQYLFRLETLSTAMVEWSVGWGVFSTAHYDPSFPHYFYAIKNDSLSQFTGADGQLVQSAGIPPTGAKFWTQPYGDDRFRLAVIDGSKISLYNLDVSTAVKDPNRDESIPTTFTLHQPYPNPFNAELSIPIEMSREGLLRVEVFNLLGQKVADLYDGVIGAGEIILSWNAASASTGLYLVRATWDGQTSTAKVVLLK